MGGKNIGDLLNAAGVTWGCFMGGFDLTVDQCQRHHRLRPQFDRPSPAPRPITSRTTAGSSTTRRPPTRMHTRPASLAAIGHNGAGQPPVRHHDFYDAISKPATFPAVSFLKAPAYQDGHAGYSDPLDEQTFIVNVINFLHEAAAYWRDTAVVIAV